MKSVEEQDKRFTTERGTEETAYTLFTLVRPIATPPPPQKKKKKKKKLVVTLMLAVATEMGQYTLPYSLQLYKIWLLELCVRWLLNVCKEEELQKKKKKKKKQKVKRLDWNFVLGDFFFELSLWLTTTIIQKGF